MWKGSILTIRETVLIEIKIHTWKGAHYREAFCRGRVPVMMGGQMVVVSIKVLFYILYFINPIIVLR